MKIASLDALTFVHKTSAWVALGCLLFAACEPNLQQSKFATSELAEVSAAAQQNDRAFLALWRSLVDDALTQVPNNAGPLADPPVQPNTPDACASTLTQLLETGKTAVTAQTEFIQHALWQHGNRWVHLRWNNEQTFIEQISLAQGFLWQAFNDPIRTEAETVAALRWLDDERCLNSNDGRKIFPLARTARYLNTMGVFLSAARGFSNLRNEQVSSETWQTLKVLGQTSLALDNEAQQQIWIQAAAEESNLDFSKLEPLLRQAVSAANPTAAQTTWDAIGLMAYNAKENLSVIRSMLGTQATLPLNLKAEIQSALGLLSMLQTSLTDATLNFEGYETTEYRLGALGDIEKVIVPLVELAPYLKNHADTASFLELAHDNRQEVTAALYAWAVRTGVANEVINVLSQGSPDASESMFGDDALIQTRARIAKLTDDVKEQRVLIQTTNALKLTGVQTLDMPFVDANAVEATLKHHDVIATPALGQALMILSQNVRSITYEELFFHLKRAWDKFKLTLGENEKIIFLTVPSKTGRYRSSSWLQTVIFLLDSEVRNRVVGAIGPIGEKVWPNHLKNLVQSAGTQSIRYVYLDDWTLSGDQLSVIQDAIIEALGAQAPTTIDAITAFELRNPAITPRLIDRIVLHKDASLQSRWIESIEDFLPRDREPGKTLLANLQPSEISETWVPYEAFILSYLPYHDGDIANRLQLRIDGRGYPVWGDNYSSTHIERSLLEMWGVKLQPKPYLSSAFAEFWQTIYGKFASLPDPDC